jgi:glutaredoxin
MLKDYLEEKKIAYVNKFIDQDEAAKAEMEAESGGFMGVPYIVITKDDGSKEKVVGFDKGKIDSILGLS